MNTSPTGSKCTLCRKRRPADLASSFSSRNRGPIGRVVHSRGVKVAAAGIALAAFIGGIQAFKTNPPITSSGGLGGQVIIPSESQAPESVPLTELTKTNGVFEIDKKTQHAFFIRDATIIATTTNPDNQNEIWLKVKLPGDTLTKTVPPTGD
jgi:hypothetical protein